MIYINVDEEGENISMKQIIQEIEESTRSMIDERRSSVYSSVLNESTKHSIFPDIASLVAAPPGVIEPDPYLSDPQVQEIFPVAQAGQLQQQQGSPKRAAGGICRKCCPGACFRSDTDKQEDLIQPSLTRQVLASTLGCANGILVGLSVGYTSVGMDSLQRRGKLGLAPFSVTRDDIGLFGSILNLGSMVGAIFSGAISQRYGRKWPSIAVILAYCAGWAMIAFPASFTTMLIGRVTCGLAEGFRAPIARMYMGEVAHPNHRGRFLSSIFMLVMAGSLVDYVLALFLDWQQLALVNAAIPLLLLPVQMALPESHVWLISKDRKEEALEALRWFRGPGYASETEHMATVKYFDDTRRAIGSWRDVLKFQYLKPVLLLVVVMLLRHFCGNTAIMFFMSQIFEMSNSGVEKRYAVIVLGSVQLFFIILSGQMMDRLGRKKSTVISCVVMGVAQAGMGLYFYFGETPSLAQLARTHNWMPLALLSLCMIGYALGVASIIIILASEIIPMQIKNTTNGIINFFNTGFAFVALESFHFSVDVVRASGTFWIFSVCCFGLAVFCLAFVPETKGQSLEEIERRMMSKRAASAAGGKSLNNNNNATLNAKVTLQTVAEQTERDRTQREEELTLNARRLEERLDDDLPSVDLETPPSMVFRLPPIVPPAATIPHRRLLDRP